MVATESKSTKIPELTVWSAEQRTWTTAKRELTTVCQNNDMDCIIDAAQAIADHIQSQYDPLRSAASAGAAKPRIKTRINEFKDAELVKMLLEKGDVVMVPGAPFGAPGYLRISFACSIAELEKAADRIRSAMV